MAVELHKTLSDMLDNYVLAWEERNSRKGERMICEKHPEWTPLTPEELSRIDRRDRWGYTVFKNMAPAGCDVSLFAAEALSMCRIVPMLNPQNHRRTSLGFDCIFADKNYHDTFMPELRFPKTVIRRVAGVFYDDAFAPISPERALELLERHDAAVFKQTVETGHGTGIRRMTRGEYDGAFRTFADDYIVQELVRQHPCLARYNESSVNVIRITTLFWRGDVYILGGILRVGAPGAFCDHLNNENGQNYLTIPLAEDGTIIPRPVDIVDYRVYSDCRGIPIEGAIPGYGRMKELVRQAHYRYPYFGLIGWDVTVGEDGEPVFIEFNTKYPGLTGSQCALGPIFGQKSVRGVPLIQELRQAVAESAGGKK